MEEQLRIGELLIAAGFVTTEQVGVALERQRESGRRLGDELVALGFLTEVQLAQVLSNQLSIPWVSLRHVEFSLELLSLVPAELANRYGLIPVYVRKVRHEGDTLFIAMDDPTNTAALEAVAQITTMPVKPMVSPPSEVRNAIAVFYFGQDPVELEGDQEPELTIQETSDEERAELEALATVPSQPAARPATAPTAERAVRGAKKRKKKNVKMITLTLLDGTSVRLPAPGSKAAEEDEPEEEEERRVMASDVIRALLRRAQGEDVSDVLPDDRWEVLFATVLTLLIRKGLIADWEFAEEWEKRSS